MHSSKKHAHLNFLVWVAVLPLGAFWTQGASAHPADEEFCLALVGNGSEEIQGVSYEATYDDEAKAIETRTAKTVDRLQANDIRGVYRVDIDNDGEIDNVVLSADGTAQYEKLTVFDAQWQLKRFELEGYAPADFTPGYAEESAIYRFKGRTYTAAQSTSFGKLIYAAVVDRGQKRLICKFGYDKTPQESIVIGQREAVCHAVLRGDLEYIELTESHGLRNDVRCFESNGPDCARPNGPSGLLDIDNDGVDEQVVSMEVSWGGGRGCGFDFLAIPEPDGSQLKRDGSGKLLLDATATWGDACSGAKSQPFRYDGAVYIENKYLAENPRNYHDIVRIAGGRVEKVCTFYVERKRFIIQPKPTVADHTDE